MVLVLWDVDHTLIATRGVGREAFASAFERATGRPLAHQSEITGRSELVIFRETLALHGLSRELVDFPTYTALLADEYVRRARDLRERGHALPGAAAALDALAGVPGVVQTAATGNVRPVAEIKLQVFGLDRHVDFELGGYGEDAEVRADMIRVALGRSGVEPGEAIIFGDTVADVEAGLATGVFVAGVATGRASADELSRAGADVVLPGLEDTAQVVELVQARN
ncbi:HAD family hydrolase [Kitasatospora kifunensis]|uniref:Phosphoglycolate phosphatase-like HAD superfamily hydrolase n=1 Tax=Kitasatospora kifunensis TaxID=58351 RepID=A0A7W7R6I0_KITKI|nr:HAD family hydrolase [Kitasatospora kifunensis]MBB4926302.1 phosphoglycolate phosphatase-like HAD superfamily hydrolase [Kitasatospora kifunensis]